MFLSVLCLLFSGDDNKCSERCGLRTLRSDQCHQERLRQKRLRSGNDDPQRVCQGQSKFNDISCLHLTLTSVLNLCLLFFI